jgi:hypothetical protein
MTLPVNRDLTPREQEALNLLAHQQQVAETTVHQVDALLAEQAEGIRKVERLLAEFGVMPLRPPPAQTSHSMPDLRTWYELVAEAESCRSVPAGLTDILTPEEIARAEARIAAVRGDFNRLNRLDALDWTISGVAGMLAALVDVILVQMPAHPGYLGGKTAAGGPLATWVRERINSTLSMQEIAHLEKVNWTPYDAATSARLMSKVAGLGPGVHRFQSLGHDPILGFLFGVVDILRGTFTAIDKHGKLIVQPVAIEDPAILTMNLFDAVGRVFGHLLSDVATPAGLPVPLMPLAQFLQFGEIGRHGYTVGEISRIMYRSHYDFRHFVAMSLSSLLIEVIVRLCYFAKRRHKGCSLIESVPFDLPGAGFKPKLRTMIFSAHLMATAANAGKVAIGQNPLLINFPQWVAFFHYAVPQVKWALGGKDDEQALHVQRALDEEWRMLDTKLESTWRQVAGDPVVLT